MTPAISCPGTLGYLISGNKPSFVTESPWQIPHACTLMRTFPSPGSGIFRSTISNSLLSAFPIISSDTPGHPCKSAAYFPIEMTSRISPLCPVTAFPINETDTCRNCASLYLPLQQLELWLELQLSKRALFTFTPSGEEPSNFVLLCFNHMIVNNVKKVLELGAG